jgi:hypothetical protein
VYLDGSEENSTLYTIRQAQCLQPLDAVKLEPLLCPSLHWLGLKHFFVESNAGAVMRGKGHSEKMQINCYSRTRLSRIPVEDLPVHSEATLFLCDLSQLAVDYVRRLQIILVYPAVITLTGIAPFLHPCCAPMGRRKGLQGRVMAVKRDVC